MESLPRPLLRNVGANYAGDCEVVKMHENGLFPTRNRVA